MIYYRNATRRHRLREREIVQTAQSLLRAAGRPTGSLSLSLVGDRAMRRLNREHRGKDRTTDVLSFPLYEPFAVPMKPGPDDPELMLGDIIISVDAAARQAAGYDATLEAEMARLLVHGLAHLLGHDHEEPRERSKMLRVEKRFARAIGMTWPYERSER